MNPITQTYTVMLTITSDKPLTPRELAVRLMADLEIGTDQGPAYYSATADAFDGDLITHGPVTAKAHERHTALRAD